MERPGRCWRCAVKAGGEGRPCRGHAGQLPQREQVHLPTLGSLTPLDRSTVYSKQVTQEPHSSAHETSRSNPPEMSMDVGDVNPEDAIWKEKLHRTLRVSGEM